MISRRTLLAGACAAPAILRSQSARRPNILFAIADDQSWLHTSAAGERAVKTPAFDRVAAAGVRFNQCFSASPGCAPSRAAILTGRYPWQLREAGTHASLFPRDLQVYPEILQKAGYFIGLTGKGAGPCNFKDAGWPQNPAGPGFDKRKLAQPIPGINANDYAANFGDFLAAKSKDAPFCFWYGGQEPHREYSPGIGLRSGKRLEDATVPPFLPDTPEVRSDILDYLTEIEHFDLHLQRMLDQLQKAGELENTIVVVTADNGMSFPGSKAQMREYGIREPLAICWQARAKGGRVCDDLISLTDLAPTYFAAAGIRPPGSLSGLSLLPLLTEGKALARPYVLSGRERHSHARHDLLGYPARALRNQHYLYVRNFAPDRWPAGDPPNFHDVDSGPTHKLMLARQADPSIAPFFHACYAKHPAEELFDIRTDPGCLKNLAAETRMRSTLAQCRASLEAQLKAQGDPRLGPHPDIWESYPRYSPTRPELGGFSESGKYNPAFQQR
ncbi:MAG: sulfatase [Acidobacteria bacterium]|nr:sulfatase [Acidobacteriota bacterium]